MKRINVSIMLVMLMSMMSTRMMAYDAIVGGICYDLDRSTLKATVTYDNTYSYYYSGDVVIPSSVSYNMNTYNVTAIGESAFSDCTGLTSITLPNSVTTIGEDAFSCTGLTSITIPNSVTDISAYAFADCTGLTSICVENGNITYDSRNDCNAIIKTATNTLVQGCKSTVIPNNVTAIGEAAFFATELTSITIPNSVTSIGKNAFSYSSLTSITIPNSVTGIGQQAFYGSGLTSITIPRSVTTIGLWVFNNCTELTTIKVEEGNAYYDSRDNCNAIIETSSNTLIACCKETIIPNSVTTIGNSMFNSVPGLTSITFPSSVTTIGDHVLLYCNDLTSVTFDNCSPTFGIMFMGSCPVSTDVYYPAYAYNYYTTNKSINWLTLHPQIKIDDELTTYCATASFDVPDGIDAYVVKGYNEGMVTLQKVTTINAGEGVLLKPANVGTFYDATLCTSTPEAYDSNMLKGVTSATVIRDTDGEYINFVFSIVDDEVSFYPANAEIIPAYTAYLQVPTELLPSGVPARLPIVIDGKVITDVEKFKTNMTTDANWYTIGGLQTKRPSKSGVYIKNGKKVIVK